MRAPKPLPTPTDEQLQALAEYRDSMPDEQTRAGWKNRLIHAWATGADYAALPDGRGSILRQIRNQFGPGWLVSFEFPLATIPPVFSVTVEIQTSDSFEVRIDGKDHAALRYGAYEWADDRWRLAIDSDERLAQRRGEFSPFPKNVSGAILQNAAAAYVVRYVLNAITRPCG